MQSGTLSVDLTTQSGTTGMNKKGVRTSKNGNNCYNPMISTVSAVNNRVLRTGNNGNNCYSPIVSTVSADYPFSVITVITYYRGYFFTESQRAMVAARLANFEANHRKFAEDQVTQSEVASLLNVSERSVSTTKKAQKELPGYLLKRLAHWCGNRSKS